MLALHGLYCLWEQAMTDLTQNLQDFTLSYYFNTSEHGRQNWHPWFALHSWDVFWYIGK